MVLVLADKPKHKTASGILLAEEWKTYPLTGKVLAIGDGVAQVKVGDRIMFERYSSIILEDDQRLTKEGSIFAILGEEDEADA